MTITHVISDMLSPIRCPCCTLGALAALVTARAPNRGHMLVLYLIRIIATLKFSMGLNIVAPFMDCVTHK